MDTGEKDVGLIMVSITRILMSHQAILSSANYALVEEQRKISPKNMWMMHHIIATLIVLCPRTVIYEIPSTYKTQLLCCPRGVDIKKWSVYRALQILQQRGDEQSYNLIMSVRKQDDLADIVLQILAFLVKMGWIPPFLKPSPQEIQYLQQFCA